jgi:NAD(P)H-nitrite reductase large subunit
VRLDDDICYCYHVTLRKLVNYARRERPSVASLMSECLGAGSGCGWCVPYLKRIWSDPDDARLQEIEPEEYGAERSAYIAEKRPRNEF